MMGLLLIPAGILFICLLVMPLLFLLRVSLMAPGPGAPIDGTFSLGAYALLIDPYNASLVWRTLRISGAVTLLCRILGYPLALSLARSSGLWRTIQIVMVISPLFVSIVVRAYGWLLLLGNRGVLNGALTGLGLQQTPTRFLGTEGAVIVGLAESLLPFMVLSLHAVIERQNPDLEKAARGLGDSALGAFWRVTLPLSLPGALAGSLLVFMVSMGSYATPALLGGSQVRLVVTEIYAQMTAVFDWPQGAALSIALLLLSLITAFIGTRLARSGRIAGAA